MLIRLFSSTFRIRPLRCWMMGMAALLIVAGPGLAQQAPWMSSSPAVMSPPLAMISPSPSVMSAPPTVAAYAAVLLNPATGEVVYAKEPHLRLPPASTTKVLTALVVLEHLDLNTRLSVSPQAASAAPSRIGLHAGDAALAQDLLYGLLLKSGNDAAETLAEGAGGSIPDFANLMNAKAWQLGARDSHFMNPHGLPNDDHYTTAYDLALIFSQAMKHPVFAEIVRTHNAALRIESGQSPYGDWRLVPVRNHNRLLASYEGARGGKTGFTLKARRCFVGEVDRGGIRLIVAILNSPNSGTLWQDARNLFDYGFARYGLAPPPMGLEPEPVMVQRPMLTPATGRVAVLGPAQMEQRQQMLDVDADEEPEPAVVRRMPAAKPAVRVAALQPARMERRQQLRDADIEEPEPVIVRRMPAAKPAVRVAEARSAQAEKRKTHAVAKTEATATPSKPASSRAVVAAKSNSSVKHASEKAAKPGAVTKAKGGKPAMTVALAKQDKQRTTKVAARSDQPGSRQPQKNVKRRG
ncbi:MAG: hypothetical protein U1F42_04750 [Candidatus Competibacteraceae bacterium]